MSIDYVMQVDFAFFFLKLSSECFDSHQEQDIFAIEGQGLIVEGEEKLPTKAKIMIRKQIY